MTIVRTLTLPMNHCTKPANAISSFSLCAVVFLTALSVGRADDSTSSRHSHKSMVYSSKGAMVRQYSESDRVRYQLWKYTWRPDPNEPITRVEVRLGEADEGLAV